VPGFMFDPWVISAIVCAMGAFNWRIVSLLGDD